jgi:radical SAM protein with 4Fe4S-binding SPASM domain
MRRRARSFLPSTAVLELTYRCNHRCIYCSCPWDAEGRGFDRLEELATEEWKEAISLLCSKGVCNLAFTGGEALLRPDAMEIMGFAASLETEHVATVDGELKSRTGPPGIYLLSNGVPVTEEVLRFCADHGIRLSLSLPGLSTFEYHTGFDHSSLVLEKFVLAEKLGVGTTANITVTKRNLPELAKTISAALLAGAGQVLLNRFLPGGRGLSNAPDLLLDASQLREMLRTADDVLTRAGRKGSMGTEMPVCVTDSMELATLNVSTRCSAAIKFFVVGPSGYVRVCNHSEQRLAHVREWEGLREDPYWNSFVMKRYMPRECSDCRQRLGCDAGCREAAHITGGRLDSLDPAVDDGLLESYSL